MCCICDYRTRGSLISSRLSSDPEWDGPKGSSASDRSLALVRLSLPKTHRPESFSVLLECISFFFIVSLIASL